MSDDSEDGETQTQSRRSSSGGRSSSGSKRRRSSRRRGSDGDNDSGYESSEGGDTKRRRSSSSPRGGKSSSSSRDTKVDALACVTKAYQYVSQVTGDSIRKADFGETEESIKLIGKLQEKLKGMSDEWMKRAEEITKQEDEVSARHKKTVEELKSGSASSKSEEKSEDGESKEESKDGEKKEDSKDSDKKEDSKDGDKKEESKK